MSRWYTVRILWTKEISRECLMRPARGPALSQKIAMAELSRKMGYPDRIKIKTYWKDDICYIIAKFKNEQDAMAFKLKYS